MSDEEDKKLLLANTDEEASADEASSKAMRQMMGFSSFGGTQKPKRQPRNPGPGKGFGTGANSQPVQPRNTSTSTPTQKTKSSTQTTPLSATSHPFVPASIPPRARKSSSKTPPPSQPLQDEAFLEQLQPVEATALPSPSPAPPASIIPTANPPPPDALSTSTAPTFNPDIYSTSSNLDDIGYTNPKTGFTMTRRELLAYERGVTEQVMNNDGTIGHVKVYFKPNFVDDNPWEDLEIKAGLKKVKVHAE